MDETTQRAFRAICDASRTLTQTLERLLDDAATPTVGTTAVRSETATVTLWDPEVDAPLVTPKVVGTREEQDWCCLTYLGGIYAINKRYGRGANREEVREYALKAGYRDGRAVTAWSKGNGATQNDEDMQRWVNRNGVNYWVKRLVDKLGLTLPPDLAEPWEAPTFS